MARPTKLKKETVDKIINLIKAGNYASQAAAASGISERTFYRWIDQGKKLDKQISKWEEQVEDWNYLSDKEKRKNKDKQPNEKDQPTEGEIELWQFWQEVKKAEAEAEAAAVLHIKKAASEGTWQAAAWYLERKFKDRWSKNDKITHEGNVDHSHTLSTGPSEREIEAAKAKLAEARQLESPNDLADLSDLTKDPDIIEAEVVEEE